MRQFKLLGVLAAGAVGLVVPATASASTVIVYAGGSPGFAKSLALKYPSAGINNFLINKVVIHVGDTVEWSGASLGGGFHTVDIPALHGSDEPLILPTGQMATGNDPAGNPFWWSGKVPAVGFNPALFASSGGHKYAGAARVDSGLPFAGPKTKNFKVTFSKAGTFKYFCDVHYGMGGEVIVKRKGTKVPTAKQNAAQLAREERVYFKRVGNALKTAVPTNTVSLGKSAPGGLELFAMFPETLRIKVGTTVKFEMSKNTRELHTASFAATPAGAEYLKKLSGSISGPVPDPAAVYPSDPPGHIMLDRTTHGVGFANTGVLDRDSATPTIPAVGAIKFTAPGTYNYECLIHSFMRGKVIVTK